MQPLGQGGAEAVEKGLHCRRPHLGEHEGEGLVGAGADGAEDPGRRVPLVDDAARAGAALVPDTGTATLLAHAGLVLAPELNLGVGVGTGGLLQGGGEAPFLNRSLAAGSALGWLGRVFCQLRSSDFTSRSMPLSR